MKSVFISILTLTLAGTTVAQNQQPLEKTDSPLLFQFGVFADAQYAQKNTVGKRHYSQSLLKLSQCLQDFNESKLAFVVNLGDIIDGNGTASHQELRQMVAVCNESKAPIKHVIGNHCLEVEQLILLKELGLSKSYYTLHEQGWTFLVLNSMEVSVKSPANSIASEEAKNIIRKNPALPLYNGALGASQYAWLKNQLNEAAQAGSKVAIFCHQPVYLGASTQAHLLWDSPDILKLLHQYPVVKAWVNGHDHAGGYAWHQGIHHLTLPGMVETAPGSNCYAIIQVYPDRLMVIGKGMTPSRELLCP